MRYIPLTKGRRAAVDDSVYEQVARFKWHAKESSKTCYARRTVVKEGKKTQVYLHRYIMELLGASIENMVVDHINGSGLDNTISNLRVCTPGENACNRRPKGNRKLKGIVRKGKSWAAQLTHDGTRYYLGTFECKDLAAAAYDKAAKKYHSEFARLNF